MILHPQESISAESTSAEALDFTIDKSDSTIFLIESGIVLGVVLQRIYLDERESVDGRCAIEDYSPASFQRAGGWVKQNVRFPYWSKSGRVERCRRGDVVAARGWPDAQASVEQIQRNSPPRTRPAPLQPLAADVPSGVTLEIAKMGSSQLLRTPSGRPLPCILEP